MKTVLASILAAVMTAAPALADPPADAPTVDLFGRPVDLDAPGRALVLEQGSITPFSGVLIDEAEDVRRERARVRAEVALKKAEESVLISRPAFVAIIVGCVTLSAVAAAGVTAWALKR